MKKALFSSAFAFVSAICFAQNPIINTSYTPDPAPFVHGNKLYLFTGHDEDDATYFKMNDWQVFSTEDMVNWTYLGTPISTETFKWAYHGDRAWAAQAIERNGKWYWYVCLNDANKKDVLAVAVADDPQGPYVDAIGAPLATGFAFIDPTVMIDKDGRAYLFWGNKGLWYGELNDDMISFKDGFKEVPGFHDPKCFGPQKMKMNWAKGKEELMVGFEEGPWVSRRSDLYYLTYPSGGVPEHMAYSTAPTINGPWTYRGRIMDEANNSFTIHGGEVTFKGHNYMFYHNGSLPNGGGFHRSASVEEFTYNPDGTIPFIPFTKEGVSPIGTLDPYQRIEGETMADSWGVKTDRLAGKDHYVRKIDNGDWIKIREVDFGTSSPASVTVQTLNFLNPGTIEFYLNSIGDNPFAKVEINGKESTQTVKIKSRRPITGKHDVYILFRGGDEQLFDFDWWKMNR
ncbi:MAG: family 43 glycosylhydrolase [Bacteroidaceae bacterium]|nr:family 43 glycosylhydrolase [Bacteroidaceae bacterium]